MLIYKCDHCNKLKFRWNFKIFSSKRVRSEYHEYIGVCKHCCNDISIYDLKSYNRYKEVRVRVYNKVHKEFYPDDLENIRLDHFDEIPSSFNKLVNCVNEVMLREDSPTKKLSSNQDTIINSKSSKIVESKDIKDNFSIITLEELVNHCEDASLNDSINVLNQIQGFGRMEYDDKYGWIPKKPSPPQSRISKY